MQQLILFITKYKHFFIFLLLETLAVVFTIQTHSYHRTKFVNSANFVTGGIYSQIDKFKGYLHLKEENQRLSEENVYLKNLLESKGIVPDSVGMTREKQSSTGARYRYISAKVINNEYNKSSNYLTINKGRNDGVKEDMGVINSKGIIGITKSVSNRYATVFSILNLNASINVKLLHKHYFGSLNWNAKDYNTLQIADLPVQAGIKVGDTVITGGMSTIFPEGIPVGVIKDFEIKNNSYSYIDVTLFNDMSAIGYVELIENFDKKEIKELESKTKNE